jgi:hypothetical protein
MRKSCRSAKQYTLALVAGVAVAALSGCSDSSDGPGTSGAAGTTMSAASTGGTSGATSSTATASSTSGAGGSSGAGTSTASSGAGGASSSGTGGASTGTSGATGSGGSAGASGASGSGGSTEGGSTDGGSDAGKEGGAADAPIPTLIPPIPRGNLHVLEFGNTAFTVDGTRGARITSYAMDGKNVLTGPEVNAQYWGSTFWTAPEAEWSPNLVVPIDSGPYMMTVGADSSITAVGGTGMVGQKLVAVTKKFTADLRTRSLVIEYTMTNKGTASIPLGHWEVTRVGPNGLTFYPAGTTAPTVPYGMINVQKIGAYLWFNHATFPAGTASKSAGDGGGGWVAHVIPDPGGDLLFIKSFADIPAGTVFPTGSSEVEIFAQADRSYVEVEVHNRQVTIAAGQSSPWQVRWYLRRLPVGTMRTAGNQALVDFVISTLN